jgi:hypothetical protein
MKKALFMVFIFLSIVTFSQSKYQYTIKFDSVTNVNKEVTDWLRGMYSAVPEYDDSNKSFKINTDFDISQSLFTQKASDKNLTLLLFTKTQLVADEPKTESPQ